MDEIVVTNKLAYLLDANFKGMGEEEIEKAMNMVCAQFEAMVKGIEALDAGRPRYELGAEIINRAYRKAERGDGPCKKGCAHCCGVQVGCGWSEGLMIADYLIRAHRVTPTWGRVVVSELMRMKKTMPRDPEEWGKVALKDRMCPFLDSRSQVCRIYQIRPHACRSYYAASGTKPSQCKVGPGKSVVGTYVSVEGEVLISAVSKVEGLGFMPSVVLKALDVMTRKDGGVK